jgi:hypothetical protein
MSKRFFVVSDTFNERVFLKLFHHGRHVTKFGLARNLTDATPFPDRVKAAIYVGRAETLIMRRFQTIEVDAQSAMAAE